MILIYGMRYCNLSAREAHNKKGEQIHLNNEAINTEDNDTGVFYFDYIFGFNQNDEEDGDDDDNE